MSNRIDASFSSSSGLTNIVRLASGIAMLLDPVLEVVLHEVATDRIVAIWNASSKRRVGDPSLLDKLTGSRVAEDQGVIGPYERADGNGERIKSISIPMYDANDQIEYLMCINLAVGAFDQAKRVIDLLCATSNPMPESLFRRDWREQSNLAVADFLRRHGKQLGALTAAERAALVGELDQFGLFEARNSVDQIARQLGISRALLYRLRRQTRGDRPKYDETE